jgi:hypothetical protein
LPELVLAADNGLLINGTSAASLDVRWAPAGAVPVGLMVQTAAGGGVGGARVRLERLASIPDAGSLVYRRPGTADVARSLHGQVRANGVAGADGSVTLPRVPPGQYRLLVTPADGDGVSALSTETLDVPAGGLAGRTVKMVARVKLRGRLLPAAGAAGTRVQATPRALDPPRPVAVATAAADGSYELEVDPEQIYVVWADPAVGRPFARVQLAAIPAGAAGMMVPDRTLPAGLAFTGAVTGGGAPLSGAVIQVFCDGDTCLDSTLPLAEGVSGTDGAFSLVLPDPGSL